MKLPSYLSLSRHRVFRFRRRVPDDLRRYFRSNELRRSLRVRDKREAVHVARMLALRTDLLFAELRGVSNGKKERAPSLKTTGWLRLCFNRVLSP
jgi:hypothetical protein